VSGRAERLSRLLAIRRLKEDMERGGLRTAMAAVAEVVGALAGMDAALSEARSTGRLALGDGRRHDWLMADAQRETAKMRATTLVKILAQRRGAAATAMETFLESRREHEQVKRLVEDSERETRTVEARRAQTAADEWFLAKPTSEL
jgi:flagellar export protein FliJ